MTLKMLEDRLSEALSRAPAYAAKCAELLVIDGLSGVLEYCTRVGIEPPKCSLTAQSPNADKLRWAAARRLADAQWWRKALEIQTVRDYECEQLAQGNVRDFVSDGVFEFTQQKKRRSE